MAYRVVVIPSVISDLEEYAGYIAKGSPERAKKWLQGAWEEIFALRDAPTKFAVIDESAELGCEVRTLTTSPIESFIGYVKPSR